MFCKPAHTYSTVETTPRNATAHTAAHVACQICGALANLPEQAEEFWSVSPLPSGTILPCVFSQLISCHVKKQKKKEWSRHTNASWISSGNDKDLLFDNGQLPGKQQGLTFDDTPCVSACVCVWLPCVESANKTKTKWTLFQECKCTRHLANNLAEMVYFHG